MSQLIDVSSLAAALDAPDLILFDVRFALDQPDQGRVDFAAGHITGARYQHLEEDLSAAVVPGQTGRHPLPAPADLQACLRRSGVNRDSLVVIYDQGPGLFAARLWWLLQWLGHEKVQVLDGGLAAWNDQQQPLTQETPRPVSEGDFVANPNDNLLIDADEIFRRLEDQSLQLIDARAPERFQGKVEPLDPVAGHIPGAVNLPCAGNTDERGQWLTTAQLKTRLEQALNGDSEWVSYCGSGVTACHNILAAVRAGLPMPRLYPGSWSEWITDPKRPTEPAQDD
ncbi:MAG: sulfurtransferase [Pseudomonas sp.]